MNLVAETVCEYFTSGINLSEDVIDFYLNFSDEFSKKGFDELESSDSDTLKELILYPDHDFKVALEEKIKDFKLFEDDVQTIKEIVIKNFDRVPIKIRWNRKTVEIEFESWLLCRFVDRLNLLNPVVTALQNEKTEPFEAVLIRDSKVEANDKNIGFLRDLIENKAVFKDFKETLKLSIKILSETKSEEDLLKGFIEKKLLFATMIQKEIHFRELLEKNNMETLMMQGVTTPAVDVEACYEKIRIINQINSVVFGYKNISDHEHFINMDVGVKFRL